MGGAVALVLLTGQALAVGDEVSDPPQNATERRYQQAVSLIEQSEFESAATMLKRITKEDPDNADAWNWLGFASRKIEDFATSEDAYDAALTIDPNHKGALEYQGELRLMQGNLAAAEINLAKLKVLCQSGSEEYNDLEQDVQAYKTVNPPSS